MVAVVEGKCPTPRKKGGGIVRAGECPIDATNLTTDRHEASRSLFATAELLVLTRAEKNVVIRVIIITKHVEYIVL